MLHSSGSDDRQSWSSDQSVQLSNTRQVLSGSARWPSWHRAPGRARASRRKAAGPDSQELRRGKRGKGKANLLLLGTGHCCGPSCSWNSSLRNFRETSSWINGQCFIRKGWNKLTKYTYIYTKLVLPLQKIAKRHSRYMLFNTKLFYL